MSEQDETVEASPDCSSTLAKKKMKALASLLLILTPILCKAGPNDWINEDKGPPYEFPWPDPKLLDAFEVTPYPNTLKSQPEEYRLFYLPPFSSPFLIVVTAKDDQTCSIKLRRLSGMGGHPDELGKIDFEDTFEITKEKTEGLLGKLRNDKVYEPLIGLTAIQVAYLESIDGNTVIIERVSEKGHSVARVSSPESLVLEMEGFVNKQGLTVYRKIELLPFTEAFRKVAEIAGFEFGAYGAVTIKTR